MSAPAEAPSAPAAPVAPPPAAPAAAPAPSNGLGVGTSPAANMVYDAPVNTASAIGVADIFGNDEPDDFDIDEFAKKMDGLEVGPPNTPREDPFDFSDDPEELFGGEKQVKPTDAKAPEKPKAPEKLAAKAKEPEPAAPAPEAPAALPETIRVRVGKDVKEVPLAQVAGALRTTPEKLALMGTELTTQMYQEKVLAQMRTKLATEELQRSIRRAERAKVDPDGAIAEYAEEIGVSVDQLAERRIMRQVEMDAMTPQQRENFQLRQELEARRQAEVQEKEQRAYRAAVEVERQKRREFSAAIDEVLVEAGYEANPVTQAVIDAHLRRERIQRGDLYEFPRSTAEMKARASAHVGALKEHDKGAVHRLFKAMGVEQFRKEFPELAEAVAEQRVKEAAARSRAQRQAPRNPADGLFINPRTQRMHNGQVSKGYTMKDLINSI